MKCVKLRSVMGSYSNIHLNLFPVYVLLLLLALSHGRPSSARVRELSLTQKSSPHQLQQYYPLQKLVQISNQIISTNVNLDVDPESDVVKYSKNTVDVENFVDEEAETGVVQIAQQTSSSSVSSAGAVVSSSKSKREIEVVDTQDDEPGEEEDEGDDDPQQLDKFRANILKELGLNNTNPNIPTIPKVNISREEYIRAYSEYMHNVRQRRARSRASFGAKDRRKNAITLVQTYDDSGTGPPKGRGNNGVERDLSFKLNLSPDGMDVRVRLAILYIPSGCRLSESSSPNSKGDLYYYNSGNLKQNSSSWSLSALLESYNFEEEDLGKSMYNRKKNMIRNNNSKSSKKNDRKLATNAGDENDMTVAVDVTRHVTSWMVHSESSPFVVKITCVKPTHSKYDNTTSSSSWPRRAQLKVVSHQISKLLRRNRSRRSLQQSSLQSFKNKRGGGRECSNTRHGKSCCRRSLKVKFSDLGISDVIVEPQEFDAHVCEGRCNARRVAYSTTHAMFQHILHQTKGKQFAPRPCCTPTKLTELDVIHLDPGKVTEQGPKLQVTILTNAIVEECGCS